jgi:hypothetical protein
VLGASQLSGGQLVLAIVNCGVSKFSLEGTIEVVWPSLTNPLSVSPVLRAAPSPFVPFTHHDTGQIFVAGALAGDKGPHDWSWVHTSLGEEGLGWVLVSRSAGFGLTTLLWAMWCLCPGLPFYVGERAAECCGEVSEGGRLLVSERDLADLATARPRSLARESLVLGVSLFLTVEPWLGFFLWSSERATGHVDVDLGIAAALLRGAARVLFLVVVLIVGGLHGPTNRGFRSCLCCAAVSMLVPHWVVSTGGRLCTVTETRQFSPVGVSDLSMCEWFEAMEFFFRLLTIVGGLMVVFRASTVVESLARRAAPNGGVLSLAHSDLVYSFNQFRAVYLLFMLAPCAIITLQVTYINWRFAWVIDLLDSSSELFLWIFTLWLFRPVYGMGADGCGGVAWRVGRRCGCQSLTSPPVTGGYGSQHIWQQAALQGPLGVQHLLVAGWVHEE